MVNWINDLYQEIRKNSVAVAIQFFRLYVSVLLNLVGIDNSFQ